MGTLAFPPMGVDVSGVHKMSFRKKKKNPARHAEKRSLPEEDQSFVGCSFEQCFFSKTLGWLFDIG